MASHPDVVEYNEFHSRYQAIFDRDAKWITLKDDKIPPEFVGSLVCFTRKVSGENHSVTSFGYISQKVNLLDGGFFYAYYSVGGRHPNFDAICSLGRFIFGIRFPSNAEIARINATTDPLYYRGDSYQLPVRFRVEVNEEHISTFINKFYPRLGVRSDQ